MTPPAIWALALSLLRRRRRASVALVVFAGLAAAAPMAVWSAGRQSGTTVDRWLERAHAADGMLTVCPPGFDPTSSDDPSVCLEYRPERELDLVRSVPGVTHAARAGFSLLRVGASPDPRSWRSRALISLYDRVAFPTVLGEPEVIAGRLAAEDAPDEVMLNEVTARNFGLRPGDRLWLGGGEGATPASDSPAVEATVTGIIRTVADLLPLRADSLGVPPLHARSAWARERADDLPPTSTVIFVWLEDGDLEGFERRLRRHMGEQSVAVSPALDEGERSNLEQATAFESRAALAVAVAAGLAVAFLVGQSVSRQVRAESSDLPTLRALGMTRRELVAVAVARWIPVAIGAVAVATVATLAASALGPVGLARRAPWDAGLHADPLVLAAGAAAVAALVLSCGAVAAYTSRSPAQETATSRAAPATKGPPGVRAGIALARRALGRGSALPVVSALVGTAVAVAAVITATAGAASLHRVTDSPERFGAPWDALVGGESAPERQADMLEALADVPGVTAAALIPGNTVIAGGIELWIQAMAPVDGVETLRPVITAGHEPTSDREIALGSITMRQLGVDLGDTVSLRSQLVEAEPLSYRVVGVTMVTDGYEPNVGKGGLVSLPGLERVSPESTLGSDVDVVVRLVDGPGRARAYAQLREALPHAQFPFPLPSSLGNAERIAGLPVFLGIAAAAIAAVTLTHALVVTVRRNRRELMVCRVLGFTGPQVYGALVTQATLIALAATTAGVVLGLIGARSGWRMMAASFGVASGVVVPAWVVPLSALAVLLVANLAAAAPGRRAASLRAAEVLRGE